MRRAQIDELSQAVRNLATNPGFEIAGASNSTVRTNLLTNPSVETLNNSTVVRTNLVKNPNFAAPLGTHWTAVGSTNTLDTTVGDLNVLKMVSTGVATRIAAIALCDSLATGTYSVSVSAMSSSALVTGFRFILYNSVSTESSAGVGTFTSNGLWQTVSATVTTTHSFDRVYFEFTGTAITTGTIGYIDKPILEVGSVPGPYFDGGSTALGTVTYNWSGTANASTSQQKDVPYNVVRTNFATNPGMETPSATQITRTNLLLNPSVEATTGISYIRNNLVLNPAFEINSNGWNTNTGNLVASRDNTVYLTGSASLKTTCAVASTGGGTNNNSETVLASAGEVFTASAYVKSSVTLSFAMMLRFRASDGANVGDFQGTQVTVTAGEWKRVSFTYTAPANTYRVFLQVENKSSMAVDDAFWIDNVLLEKTNAVLPYFDASYPIQNMVTNPSMETDVNYWAADTGAPTLSLGTEHSYIGTKSLKAVNTVATADVAVRPSGYNMFILPDTTYSLSWWVYSASARTEVYADVAGIGTGVPTNRLGQVSIPAKVWTRITATFTTGVNASPTSSLSFYLHHAGGPAASGEAIWIDGVVLERQNSPSAGFYTGTGDFTYVWAGTAHASVSEMRAVGISNWFNAGSSSRTYSSTLVSRDGTASLALRRQDTLAGNSYFIGTQLSLTAGKNYTVSFYAYGGVGTYDTTIVGSGVSKTNFAAPGNTWTRISYTFAATATVSNAYFQLTDDPTGTRIAGSTLYVDSFMLEESTTLRPYFDGSNSLAMQNLCSNPSVEVDATGWSPRWFGSTGGTGTSGRSAGTGINGGASYRKTWTTANTGASQDTGVSVEVDVLPGRTYTFSVYQRSSVAQKLTPFVQFKNSTTGSSVTATSTSLEFDCPRNKWVRGYVTITAPPGAYRALFIFGPYVNAAPMAAGDFIDWDRVLIEESSTLNPYYEGTGDFTYAWTGAVNTTTSDQKSVACVSGYTHNGLRPVQSSIWTAGGTKSLRTVVTAGNTNDTSASIEGDVGALRSGMVAGKTYTISATCRIDAAQTGSLSSRARKIVFFHAVTPGVYTEVASSQLPNVAGSEARLSVTVTLPAGTTEAFARLYNGAYAGGGDVYWDNVLVEEVGVALPYFDGSTAVNNLANTPSGLGTITWTNNVSYAGTTWTRVATSTNGHGARAMVNLEKLSNDLPYVISVTLANDQTVSQTISQDFGDSGGMTITLEPGEIRRTSYTATPTNVSTVYRFADFGITTTSGSRSILFKDWTVEPGTVATDIDFRYSWTGLPHVSTSTMSAPTTVGATDVPSLCKAYSSSTWASFGGRSLRITAKSSTNNDSFAELNPMLGSYTFKANTTYTLSADRYLTAPLTGSLAGAVRASISGELAISYPKPVVNTAGVNRMVATFTTGANTTLLFVRLYNGSSAGNGDVWWDRIILEEGATDGSYFDGSTTAAGDFNYAWTGTANASSSLQRGTLLPSMLGSIPGGDGVAINVQSSDWSASGTKSLRIIPTGKGNYSYAYFNSTSIPDTLVRGRTYTLLAKLRLTAVQTGTLHAHARKIGFSGGVAGQEQYSAQAPNAIGIHSLKVTFTVPETSPYKLLMFINGSASTNEHAWYDDVMLVEGAYEGDYIDGTRPFAKWEGTANASASIGYPPQLLDIAGKPTIDLTGGQTHPNSTVDGFAARTFYICYEITDINAGSWQVPFTHGLSPTVEGFTLQTNVAGSPHLAPRADFQSPGDSNSTFQISNGRTQRVHVVAITFPQGLTSVTASLNGGVDGGKAYNPGTVGWTQGQAKAFNPTGIKTHRVLGFYAEHNATTRLAISRYLGNKYGASIA